LSVEVTTAALPEGNQRGSTISTKIKAEIGGVGSLDQQLRDPKPPSPNRRQLEPLLGRLQAVNPFGFSTTKRPSDPPSPRSALRSAVPFGEAACSRKSPQQLNLKDHLHSIGR
jgi:hypothetical protein